MFENCFVPEENVLGQVGKGKSSELTSMLAQISCLISSLRLHFTSAFGIESEKRGTSLSNRISRGESEQRRVKT